MVIKGRARSGPEALARHLLRTDHNKRVTIRELYGVEVNDLTATLREMHALADMSGSWRSLYHAQINTAPGERLTEAQKLRAVDRLEQELGFEGQPRVVVEHVKARKGQDQAEEHMHVVWSRIDATRGIAIHDGHNYRKHEAVSRELEREFGHEHVPGVHIERDGRERPARTPSHAEMQQAQRTKRTPQQAKLEITRLWNEAATGRAFTASLEEAGWTLAQGDRRDFVLLDGQGEVHSLARRIDGVKAAQIRDRMADVDRERLPTVDQAREIARQRSQIHEPAREIETSTPPSRAAAHKDRYELEDIAAGNREQIVIQPENPARDREQAYQADPYWNSREELEAWIAEHEIRPFTADIFREEYEQSLSGKTPPSELMDQRLERERKRIEWRNEFLASGREAGRTGAERTSRHHHQGFAGVISSAGERTAGQANRARVLPGDSHRPNSGVQPRDRQGRCPAPRTNPRDP